MIITGTFSIVFMFIFTFNMMAKNTNFNELRNPLEAFGSNLLFNVGILENIKATMGDNPLRWWIPEKSIQRSINGIDFPTRYDVS